MRLSEAIALGRTLVKPVRCREWHPDGSGCARGMALEAIGRRMEALRYSNLERFMDEWRWTFQETVDAPCQCYGPKRENVATLIAHLFDKHVEDKDWTLDQLIDWVRSVEPAPAAPAAAEQHVAETLAVRR